MDIDLFSKMIKELILDSDRVVLPGLGCFVAEMVPATFSDKGYTINPPYRRLSFRSKPDADDALMNFYAESNGLDRDVACRILGDFIAELRTVIFTKKLVVLPGLGRLRATKENNIFFIADEDLDIYPAGFGLEPISLKTHQETRQEVIEAVAGLRSILDDAPAQENVSEAELVAAVDSEPVVESDPAIEPEPTVEPVPVVEPEQIVEPVPVVEPDPAIEPEPVVEPEPVEEPFGKGTDVPDENPPAPEVVETEPVPEVMGETMLEFATEPAGRKTCRKKALLAFGIPAAIAVILLVAFIVAARVAPEWIDSLLYTPEELEIINHVL
jgi:hypothetical protein